MLLGVWSLTWNLPPLIGGGRYDLEGVGTSCAPDWYNRQPRDVSYMVVHFIILVSYTKLVDVTQGEHFKLEALKWFAWIIIYSVYRCQRWPAWKVGQ